MTDDANRQGTTWPLHDASAALVQRTVRAALWLGAAASLIMAGLHWLDPLADPVHRVVPLVLGVGLALLAVRQARRPGAMAGTLWVAWWLAIATLAVPTWWFLARSLRSGELLVELLPPVGAALPPLLVGMALFAKPRVAMTATLIAWAAVALPVLAYLGMHLPQLWTPRGTDLLLSLGPGALFVPLLVPLLRGMERRLQ